MGSQVSPLDCSLCFSYPANVILHPCGHSDICHNCVESGGLKNSCPWCRQDIYRVSYYEWRHSPSTSPSPSHSHSQLPSFPSSLSSSQLHHHHHHNNETYSITITPTATATATAKQKIVGDMYYDTLLLEMASKRKQILSKSMQIVCLGDNHSQHRLVAKLKTLFKMEFDRDDWHPRPCPCVCPCYSASSVPPVVHATATPATTTTTTTHHPPPHTRASSSSPAATVGGGDVHALSSVKALLFKLFTRRLLPGGLGSRKLKKANVTDDDNKSIGIKGLRTIPSSGGGEGGGTDIDSSRTSLHSNENTLDCMNSFPTPTSPPSVDDDKNPWFSNCSPNNVAATTDVPLYNSIDALHAKLGIDFDSWNRFAPKLLLKNRVKANIISLSYPSKGPCIQTTKLLCENIMYHKPHIIIMYHDLDNDNSIDDMLAWDRFVRAKIQRVPRLWVVESRQKRFDYRLIPSKEFHMEFESRPIIFNYYKGEWSEKAPPYQLHQQPMDPHANDHAVTVAPIPDTTASHSDSASHIHLTPHHTKQLKKLSRKITHHALRG